MFPWPPAEDSSVLDALGKTWQESMFRPTQFFAAMPKEESSKPALVYALIIGLLSVALTLFWSFVIPGGSGHEELTKEAIMAHPWQMLLHPSRPSMVDLLLSPVYILGAIFIGAGILHLMLMVFVSERGSFWRTLRIMCYSRSPGVLAMIPVLGMLVGGIWTIVITIIGVREAHTTTTGRAATAVLLPGGCLLILAVLLLAVVFLVLGGIGGALGAG